MPARNQTRVSRPTVLERLETAVRQLAERGRFSRGDLVRWRQGCADGPLPRGREPAVVVQHNFDGIVTLIAIGADGGGVPVKTEAWRLEPLTARAQGVSVLH